MRKFIIGSEWLYLKIYAGVKTSDLILEEAIMPLVAYLHEEKYISKWFFIRYNDPKPHLRVRFNLQNTGEYSRVLERINIVLQEYVNSGEISSIQTDIYSREIERYGKATIEDAETLFYRNSELAIQCLDYDDEEKIIASLFYIDKLLDRLNLSIDERMKWVNNYNIAFKKEFNADKRLNSQLDKKYRAFKPKFMDFIQSEEFSEERELIIFNLDEMALILQNIIYHSENQTLEVSMESFFKSLFHMNINRLFVSNQRVFEMVIYDYLHRYYKTLHYQVNNTIGF
ncbi:thiopeptide-type bacteriocin biosynthesis protein [Chryseobacterium sediminis]|uniref:Thiopeptide-type bacteriocin biosynthesis protein n=1 Tax=Chryseobacterium sediminis TaxID=1679494 RepID=A0ABR6PZM4_9FLAO|nr:thiopeptide-type bacteriocin biosynthesis protein [Chryseobacterium sediminis]MBB6330886.1 thiopeptide-type bacteriocin biosynthesis protein [Chryseobacterium sediminis]